MCSVMLRACLARELTAIRTFPGPTLTRKWTRIQTALCGVRGSEAGAAAHATPDALTVSRGAFIKRAAGHVVTAAKRRRNGAVTRLRAVTPWPK